TAGRPVPSGYEEEEAAKDHGLKQSPARHGPGLPPWLRARSGLVLFAPHSLAGPGAGLRGRRPSLGPLPPLGSRVSSSGLPLAAARRAAPSYHTESAPRERCEAACAQQALEAALEAGLREACYSHAEAGRLAPELCELVHVRLRLRELSPPRYKLVCSMVAGAAQHSRAAASGLGSSPAAEGGKQGKYKHCDCGPQKSQGGAPSH
uniref:Dynein light chain Tctex-type 4 n=1 Tax=Phocoena sinus TaxID=42100 RepID=A0A8C9DYV6_PHOSS